MSYFGRMISSRNAPFCIEGASIDYYFSFKEMANGHERAMYEYKQLIALRNQPLGIVEDRLYRRFSKYEDQRISVKAVKDVFSDLSSYLNRKWALKWNLPKAPFYTTAGLIQEYTKSVFLLCTFEILSFSKITSTHPELKLFHLCFPWIHRNSCSRGIWIAANAPTKRQDSMRIHMQTIFVKCFTCYVEI